MDTQTITSAHKTEASKMLSPMGRRFFKYIEFDDNEELIAEIRKHGVGLFFIWLSGLFITSVIVITTSLLALNLNNLGLGSIDVNGTVKSIIVAAGMVLALLALIMTVITAIIYQSNVVFVTSEKIAEVLYASILNRRVMQLGVGNVEDVTVTQRGILPHLFNYGGLVVETAGEIENPAFTYVPNPNKNAQLITRAHEMYVEKYGN